MASGRVVVTEPRPGWREIVGDFSQLEEHDRPPRFIREGIAVGNRIHWDKSETRVVLPQAYPGRPLLELAGKHSGERGALLFNGASLASCDLSRIDCAMIGMNRTHVGYETYRGPSPTYLCVIDVCWLNRPAVLNHPGLLNATSAPKALPNGWRVKKSFRVVPFSFDLHRDGAVPPTTGHLALQVAVYLGFSEIFLLGMDLGGAHYDGTPSGRNMEAQLTYLTQAAPLIAARGVKVWLCNSPDSLARELFPHITFDEAFPAPSKGKVKE